MAGSENKKLQANVDLVRQATKAYSDFSNQVPENIAQAKALLDVTVQLNKQLKASTGLKAFTDEQKKVKASIQQTAEATKQSIDIQKKEEQLKREKIRTAQAEEKQLKKVATAAEKANSAYSKASTRLNDLRKKAKDTALQFGLNSKEFRRTAAEVNKLDGQLKKIDGRLGQSQRFVGQYGKALGGLKSTMMSLAGALGFVGGIQLATKAFKDGIRTARNYEKANAELAGVLGKQRKDLVKLQKESKRLGSTTAFTASEVTALQIELARLGKSEEDIISSTEGIIDATVALGSETAETAALVGATLNAFNLGAEKSSQVADVLTLSTQRSALSFEKLNTALPVVGGAAAAAGVKLETVVAQLGQAADRGIDASTAATSLRNIYIELAAKGLTLEESLAKINGSQNKLTTANELFGKRAAVTALALAETTTKTDELATALENAGGTAKKVAEEQLNTLDGSLRLLSSAYEGLVLEIFKTDGAIKLVDGLSAAISNLVRSFKTIDELSKETSDSIVGAIKAAGGSAEDQLKRLDNSIAIASESLATLEEQRAALMETRATGAGLVDPQEIATLAAEINKQKKILEEFNQFRAALNEQAAIERIDLTGETTEELIRWEGLYTNSFAALSEDQIRRLKAIEIELKKRNNLVEQGTNAVEAASQKQATELQSLSELQKTLSKDAADSVVKDWDFISGEAIKNGQEINMSVRTSQQIFEDAERAKTDIAREESQKRKELNDALTEAGFESAGILADQFFANGQMRRDQETQSQIDAMNLRLENDTLDAEQRELIQAQIAAKEKKLKTDQAKADKKAAIIQSITNTALSIGKTAATLGFPLAIPFIAFAAATGLAQQIAIASQPLPKFDKGTKSAPGGGFWAGEKRTEFMKHKGVVSMVDRPTIFGDDYKGAEIIGGNESARIIDQMTRQQVIEGVASNNKGIEGKMIQLAFDKAIQGQTQILANELRKNRPVKQDSRDWRSDKSYNKFRE
ncbi:MAG: phage tail tape measure protein [Colwellia sp.]|nr:phage tail tape measure protein [Colwellia sp.]